MPEVPGGENLLLYFFEMGPAGAKGPLTMHEVRSWAPILIGFDEWPNWQARLFVRLSREYCAQQNLARDWDAQPPWQPAVAMWRWVRNWKAEKQLDRAEREIEQRMEMERQGIIKPHGMR